MSFSCQIGSDLCRPRASLQDSVPRRGVGAQIFDLKAAFVEGGRLAQITAPRVAALLEPVQIVTRMNRRHLFLRDRVRRLEIHPLAKARRVHGVQKVPLVSGVSAP